MDCQEIRRDLRATAASYSAQRQQSAQLLLRREGRLLRHNPDPLAIPGLAERRQECGPVCLPVLPPYNLQHRRTFFRFCYLTLVGQPAIKKGRRPDAVCLYYT